MKNLIFSCLLIYLVSCDKKKLNYYHGVVVDVNLIPISGVIVKTEFSNSTFTITKKNGYFKLSRTPKTLESLIFSKEGHKTDTVRTVWTQSGEFIDYSFIYKKLDTLILKEITLPNNGNRYIRH